MGFRCLLESGTPRERWTVIEENIERIVERAFYPNRPFEWCREPDSNRHGLLRPTDFKSVAYTSFAIPALWYSLSGGK